MLFLRRPCITLCRSGTKPTIACASRSSLLRSSPCRLLFSSKDKSDGELQESFHGFLPKLIWTLQVLSTDAGLESYRVLNKKGHLGPSPKSLYVFALLQNPLLAKYGFDPADFIVGAESAYHRYAMASSSVEIFDFANGRLKTSEAAQLVRQSIWKVMYDANFTVLKQLEEGPIRVVETLDISDIQIDFAKTSVVTDDGNNGNDSLVLQSDIQSFSVVKSPAFRKRFFRYPSGSVVATVGVKFMVTDKYRQHVRGSMLKSFKANFTPDEWKIWSTKIHTRIYYKLCVFEGCISGHVPLDWKIAGYDWIGLK